MPRKKRASKDAYSQATRLGGDALCHALGYARVHGCTLRLAIEAIAIRDRDYTMGAEALWSNPKPKREAKK